MGKTNAPPRALKGFTNVTDFINSRTGKFTNLWQRDTDLLEDLDKLMEEVYEDALLEAQGYTDPSSDDIHGAFRGIKTSRAGGSDFLRKQDITTLPPPAITQLGGLIGNTVRNLALPHKFLLNCIALAPKPKGGERLITVTSIVYGAIIRLVQVPFWTGPSRTKGSGTAPLRTPRPSWLT